MSVEPHTVAMQRMIGAGASVMTLLAAASEWLSDHARKEHIAEFVEVLKEHELGSGIAFQWEQQLLNTPVETLQSSRFSSG